jgi:hypothetical protein
VASSVLGELFHCVLSCIGVIMEILSRLFCGIFSAYSQCALQIYRQIYLGQRRVQRRQVQSVFHKAKTNQTSITNFELRCKRSQPSMYRCNQAIMVL